VRKLKNKSRFMEKQLLKGYCRNTFISYLRTHLLYQEP
jgi:hypothetical protein